MAAVVVPYEAADSSPATVMASSDHMNAKVTVMNQSNNLGNTDVVNVVDNSNNRNINTTSSSSSSSSKVMPETPTNTTNSRTTTTTTDLSSSSQAKVVDSCNDTTTTSTSNPASPSTKETISDPNIQQNTNVPVSMSEAENMSHQYAYQYPYQQQQHPQQQQHNHPASPSPTSQEPQFQDQQQQQQQQQQQSTMNPHLLPGYYLAGYAQTQMTPEPPSPATAAVAYADVGSFFQQVAFPVPGPPTFRSPATTPLSPPRRSIAPTATGMVGSIPPASPLFPRVNNNTGNNNNNNNNINHNGNNNHGATGLDPQHHYHHHASVHAAATPPSGSQGGGGGQQQGQQQQQQQPPPIPAPRTATPQSPQLPPYMSTPLGTTTTYVPAYSNMGGGPQTKNSSMDEGWADNNNNNKNLQQTPPYHSPQLHPQGFPISYSAMSRPSPRSYSFDETILPAAALDASEQPSPGAGYSPYGSQSSPGGGMFGPPAWPGYAALASATGSVPEMYGAAAQQQGSPLQPRPTVHMPMHHMFPTAAMGGLAAGAGGGAMRPMPSPGGGVVPPYGQFYPASSPGPPIQTPGSNKGPEGANLFIFHIPNHFTNLDMYQLFCPYGNLLSVRIMVEKDTGRSRGFGFVSYDSPESAACAIKELNGFAIGNKRLKVQHKQIRQHDRDGNHQGGVYAGGAGDGNYHHHHPRSSSTSYGGTSIAAASSSSSPSLPPPVPTAPSIWYDSRGPPRATTPTTTTTSTGPNNDNTNDTGVGGPNNNYGNNGTTTTTTALDATGGGGGGGGEVPNSNIAAGVASTSNTAATASAAGSVSQEQTTPRLDSPLTNLGSLQNALPDVQAGTTTGGSIAE